MNRRTLFKILATLPFIGRIPAIHARAQEGFWIDVPKEATYINFSITRMAIDGMPSIKLECLDDSRIIPKPEPSEKHILHNLGLDPDKNYIFKLPNNDVWSGGSEIPKVD